MKDIEFNEILKRENGEYIMRLRLRGRELCLSVRGANVEVLEPQLWGEEGVKRLLEALPRLDMSAAFIISGAPYDLPEDAVLSAAEKNWSIVI